MAKALKKSKKSKVKVTKPKIQKPPEVLVPAPAISPGLVSVAMLPSDLATLTNLMAICAKSFEEQAMEAIAANDEAKYSVLAARHKLSLHFADKFVEFCKIGEPESREFH